MFHQPISAGDRRQNSGGGGSFEAALRRFFFRYAAFVARNCVAFVAVPLLFSICCCVGFLHRSVVLDAIFLYTPVDAPSRTERQVVNQLFPVYNGNYDPSKVVTDQRQCLVTVSTINGSANILNKELGSAVEALNEFISRNISIRNSKTGELLTFQQLCLRTSEHTCYNNSVVGFVNSLHQTLPDKLTFPTVRIGSRPVYLGSALSGVVLKDGSNVIKSAEAWMLVYHLQYYPDDINQLSMLWEREFQKQLSSFKSDSLRVTFAHSQTLNEELQRNADRIKPRFVVTFLVLLIFSVLCSLVPKANGCSLNCVRSKPLLAVGGVINAGMAVASSLGLFSVFGYIYNDIVAVMPFLVVSIGVDNMFLMMAAWSQTSPQKQVEQRLAESLSECAVSILVTMLTDIFSFGIGAITTIPAVKIFCLYTSAAVGFTLLYQLTFFLGLMTLFGKAEEKRLHCITFKKVMEPESITPESRLSASPMPEIILAKDIALTSGPRKFFSEWYAPVLMHPMVKRLVVAWLALYLGTAIYGCTQLREGLRPVDLLVHDSYAVKHYESLEKYFWAYGPQVQVVVRNVSDLSRPKEQQKIMQMVAAFSNAEHSVGVDGVQFFLPDFLRYLNAFNYTNAVRQNSSVFYTLLTHDYLNLSVFSHWQNDIIWDASPTLPEKLGIESGSASEPKIPTSESRIAAFRFSIGLRRFRTSNEQRDAMVEMRRIASTFSNYDVITFAFLWLFADQYRVVLSNTLQNVVIALAIMVIICVTLIPRPLCAMWVALSILSIDLGVVGYMTLWGVNLDAVSMITIIMSIGFSVDFSAHITYGFVVSKATDNTKRIQDVLGSLGWPVVQGGLSTVLGVLTLADAEAYMIVTFFKTVLLVIVIGLVHGIIFLPVLLSLYANPTGAKGCCGVLKCSNKGSVPKTLAVHGPCGPILGHNPWADPVTHSQRPALLSIPTLSHTSTQRHSGSSFWFGNNSDSQTINFFDEHPNKMFAHDNRLSFNDFPTNSCYTVSR